MNGLSILSSTCRCGADVSRITRLCGGCFVPLVHSDERLVDHVGDLERLLLRHAGEVRAVGERDRIPSSPSALFSFAFAGKRTSAW